MTIRTDDDMVSMHGQLRAENLDEIGRFARVGGWQIGAMQTTAGTLACARSELMLEGLQWLDEDLRNVTLSMFGDPPPGCVVFGVVLRGEPTVRINGRAWRTGEIAMGWGDGATEVVLPPARVVSLAVQRDVLSEHLLLRHGALSSNCDMDAPLMLVRDPALVASTRAGLSHLADGVAAHFQDQPMSLAQGQALRGDILDLLGDLILAVRGDRGSRVAMRRSLQVELVRQARQHVAGRSADALQVEDLCRVTRVSRRTLQRCFLDVVGVTPVHYLRLNRLTHARSMLLESTPGRRVQDVLGDLGIWHASRFAAEYRALFGELPSETLKGACRH